MESAGIEADNAREVGRSSIQKPERQRARRAPIPTTSSLMTEASSFFTFALNLLQRLATLASLVGVVSHGHATPHFSTASPRQAHFTCHVFYRS